MNLLLGYFAARPFSDVIADASREHCVADSVNAWAGSAPSPPPASVIEKTTASPTLRNRVIPSSCKHLGSEVSTEAGTVPASGDGSHRENPGDREGNFLVSATRPTRWPPSAAKLSLV